ncbi:MAG: copper resistance protein CopC [Paenibacillaceae bacterium]
MKHSSRLLLSLIALICIMLMPSKLYAHSSLIAESPTPSSVIATSPAKVELTFNERLEKELFYIKVFNSTGKSVTNNKTVMSTEQKQLELALPLLIDGIYTVSYKILSADGHPVGGSYVFTIGHLADAANNTDKPALQISDGLSPNMPLVQYLIFSSRFLFFVSLLGLCGWIFWSNLFHPEQGIIQFNRKGALILQRIFLISLLLMIYAQLQELLSVWEFQNLLSLLFKTSVGYSWVFSMVLAISGFFILFRSKLLDMLWITLILAAKVANGHAMSIAGNSDVAILDWVHLFAASIWVGGLIYFLTHWRNFPTYSLELLAQFSKFAFFSMLLLTVSGTFYSLGIVHKISYLFYTQWGILLLIKVSLVLLVFGIGAALRYYMKKNQERSIKTLIRLDLTSMTLIMLIVGVFTYLNPLPVNTPLYWHQMGETIHMTTQITPKIPGKNTFSVQIWMPENIGKPKRVELWVTYKNDSTVAPIEVPIKNVAEEVDEADYGGFRPYTYTVEGPYLPFPGKWALQLTIVDKNDVETQYDNEMMLF